MGYEAYTQARDAQIRNGERARAEAREEQQFGLQTTAANALAKGDRTGAINALGQSGDVRSVIALQADDRTRQAEDREQHRSAYAAGAQGLLRVPPEQRWGLFQQRVVPTLRSMGVPDAEIAGITEADMADGTLNAIAALNGADAPRAPSGYRYAADGNLEAIPGGPDDPKNQRWQVTPYGLIPPAGWSPPQGQQGGGPPEYVDALPPGVRPRPNQAPSAPAAGGAERTQTPRVSFQSSQDARSHISKVVPGITPTSGTRTPEQQRRLIAQWEAGGRKGVRPADNSHHLQGRAWDLVPPGGMTMAQLASKMRSEGFRVLDEGDHVHVSW